MACAVMKAELDVEKNERLCAAACASQENYLDLEIVPTSRPVLTMRLSSTHMQAPTLQYANLFMSGRLLQCYKVQVDDTVRQAVICQGSTQSRRSACQKKEAFLAESCRGCKPR